MATVEEEEEEEDKEDEEPIVETIRFLQGVSVLVCGQESGSVRLVLGVLCFPGTLFQLVLTSGGHRVDPAAQWISCLLHLCCSIFLVSVASVGCHSGGQCRQYQRQHRSYWAFCGTQAVLSWYCRVDTAWSPCSADTSCTRLLACTFALVRR